MQFKIIPSSAGINSPPIEHWKNTTSGLSSVFMPMQGRMFCHTAEGTVEIKPENIYLIPNRAALHFELDSGSNYKHLYLNFRAFPPLLGQQPLCIEIDKDPYLFHVLKALEALVHKQTIATGECVIRNTVNPFWRQARPLAELLAHHFYHHYGIETMDHPKLVRAVSYIEEHFREALRNDDIAAQLQIDPRYLIRLFRKNMYLSPHEYLTQCRIDHAMSLLWEKAPVAEVAERCGFQSENAFRIAFKKYTGVPPTHFLKNN